MEAILKWLAANPYILLFVVVGGAVLLGKVTIKGYGLGMVASAIVVGAAVSAMASTYGIKMSLDNFTRLLFYYLFMYGVGLRVGPSFINSLTGDGLKFTILAILCSVLGLLGAVTFARWWDLPAGSAGGILAGSMTMSAAIGSAEEAVRQGVFPLAPGQTFEDVSGMIALSYGLTYIWGTVGIILLCKYLPRWWGVDAKEAAKQYEDEHGVSNVDDAGLTGYRPLALRAYKLANSAVSGWTARQFMQKYPEYKIVNVHRGSHNLGVPDDLELRQGDVIVLGGRLESITDNIGLIGPEVADAKALNIPLDQAEILVTNKDYDGKPLVELRATEFSGQLALQRIERGGVPIPLGLDLKLHRFDVLFVTGLKSGAEKAAAALGKLARPSTATDLLTLSLGMILGFLIGAIGFPIAGAKVGLGNAGGLLVSGVIVSSAVSRLRFFGNTPNAARNILEDLGLIVFIAIVGINAGAALVSQLTGQVALYIFIAGFICTTVPPFIVWAIGYHIMKINPAVLMGGVAGARSHSGPAREAAKEIGSSVPWIGFPVGYAVSGVLLTVFGYVAMLMSK
ncbi:aspartate:alanine exchanger family transporter [Cupriavidus pinatubonensis]|uniref:Aspartate/alanine antiporter n=1 Tax=Cupriavidus pinatubonensis TaxID=248026 RepID=A0ABM8Y3Y1_9BURK|nr:TrkA C-terminal domain-containing protein [Cupriavidus pinatubonensis]CAG9187475.1 Aspartate/alanine antiporter [Cupriavidus pinatubonensis]